MPLQVGFWLRCNCSIAAVITASHMRNRSTYVRSQGRPRVCGPIENEDQVSVGIMICEAGVLKAAFAAR